MTTTTHAPHAPSSSRKEAAFSVNGMDCASCVAHVQKALNSTPGVINSNVNLARGRATVEYADGQVTLDQIATAITASGYPAIPESPAVSAGNTEQQRLQRQMAHARIWRNRAILGLILWAPLEAWHQLTMFNITPHWQYMDWALFAGATIAMIFIGWGFYRGAWNGLKRRTTNMDTLIAMGTTVAYLYSAVALIGEAYGRWTLDDSHLYFTEAIGLLALISLGHWMEARARAMAGSAIRELLQLAPTRALRLDQADQPQEVNVDELLVGDRVLVRPGDSIPIDGEVVQGRSAVDEAMLTGEPIPVTRSIGDMVIGGTINQDGRLVVQVRKTGQETALAQIVQAVEKAQASKPPVQQLADQISAIFVPTVLGIALVTGIGWWIWGTTHDWPQVQTWGQIAKTVCSVLIIACPCALGLAIPAALMVGTGRGARRGILIRDIDALQNAEHISTVVLDKTGTITQGKPAVTKIVAIARAGKNPDGSNSASNEDEILRLTAAAEQFSEHPLARAIVAYARQRGVKIPEVDHFNSQAGLGVVAEVEGRTLLVGNDALLQSHGQVTSGYPPQSAGASTIVHVALKQPNGEVDRLGLVILADQIKSDSASAIASLKTMGLQTVLLTGDNKATALAIAKTAGIQEVLANVKPREKAAVIQSLQRNENYDPATTRFDPSQSAKARKSRVAMVGDGINDAPALASADLGIAIGSGSDIAKETGGIVLVSGSLTGIATAIKLSRATMKKIRQNLFFAFIYNVLAIPLAAFGFLNPLIAAGAMALSDITVIGNALLLRRTKID